MIAATTVISTTVVVRTSIIVIRVRTMVVPWIFFRMTRLIRTSGRCRITAFGFTISRMHDKYMYIYIYM